MKNYEMSEFLEKYIMMGFEDSDIIIEKFKSEISEIKGIGESRLNQIMKIIINNIYCIHMTVCNRRDLQTFFIIYKTKLFVS